MNKNLFDCDDVEDNVKRIVIDELYRKIDLNNHKFIRVTTNEHITDLKNKKYYISANYGGITAFLFFLKINNTYNCFLIDRRSLPFDKNKKNKCHDVRLKRIYLSINIKFYNDTILDCIKIDDVLNGKIQIIILDVLYFGGKNLIKHNYKHKMTLFERCVTKNYLLKNNDNAIMYITPVYELNEIKELYVNYIKLNYDKLRIRGLAFYPNTSGNRIIYLTTKEDNYYKELMFDENHIIEQTTHTEVEQTNNVRGEKYYKICLKDLSYDAKIILNINVVKTLTPDVYKLYSLFEINNKIIKNKIGCAYIPNYNTSLKCRQLFANIDEMIMECEFNNKTAKFIPIKKASVQKMHIINNDGRLNISVCYKNL